MSRADLIRLPSDCAVVSVAFGVAVDLDVDFALGLAFTGEFNYLFVDELRVQES